MARKKPKKAKKLHPVAPATGGGDDTASGASTDSVSTASTPSTDES